MGQNSLEENEQNAPRLHRSVRLLIRVVAAHLASSSVRRSSQQTEDKETLHGDTVVVLLAQLMVAELVQPDVYVPINPPCVHSMIPQ